MTNNVLFLSFFFKLFCVTTDNASSNGTFVQQLARLTSSQEVPFDLDQWIRCFAHILNLSVQDALVCLKPIMKKLRKLVKAIKASPQRLDKLKEALQKAATGQLPEYTADIETFTGSMLVPKQDVVTRWSSGHFMNKRAIEIRPGLDYLTATERELRECELQDEDWKRLGESGEFLEPFAEITTFVEGMKYPTLSAVVPLFDDLLRTLEGWKIDMEKSEEIRDACEAAILKLQKYQELLSPVAMIATTLDPRLKYDYFEEHYGAVFVEASVKPMYVFNACYLLFLFVIFIYISFE